MKHPVGDAHGRGGRGGVEHARAGVGRRELDHRTAEEQAADRVPGAASTQRLRRDAMNAAGASPSRGRERALPRDRTPCRGSS